MIFFTGMTALDYWRFILRSGLDRPTDCYSRYSLPDVFPKMQQLLESAAKFSATPPLEIAVANSCCQHHSKHVRCFVRSHYFPRGSFLRIGERIYVASPQMVFLEMANRLDLVYLAQLGFELASGYIQDDTDLRGFKQCEPLMHVDSLQKFIDHMTGWTGIKKARRASRYIAANSASPMETKLALRLSLPRKLGGYGLPKPEMNHQIILNRDFPYYPKRTLYFDLYWQDAKLDVEYDSDIFHSGTDKLRNDSIRRNVINAMNYDVLTITSVEYYNFNAMVKIAKTIARKLRIEFKRITPDQKNKMQNLKNLLEQKAY